MPAAVAGQARRTPPRALLVGVALGQSRAAAATAGMPAPEHRPASTAHGLDLAEIDALARSAGITPVASVTCRRARQDPALYIGSGKAEEFAALIEEQQVDVVIFDAALGAVQQRNLSRFWDRPVIDRTELILDIFGQRARSNEGKLQVELARIEHQMSRLVRGWTHLERQRGGVGLRGGPGEKQIELDRRMLDQRVEHPHLRRDEFPPLPDEESVQLEVFTDQRFVDGGHAAGSSFRPCARWQWGIFAP